MTQEGVFIGYPPWYNPYLTEKQRYLIEPLSENSDEEQDEAREEDHSSVEVPRCWLEEEDSDRASGEEREEIEG